MAEQKTSSSRPSNSPILIAVVVVALGGLVGLNMMANQARPKSDHEIEAEQKEQASAAATPSPAVAASTAPGAPGMPPGPPGATGSMSSDANSLVLAGTGSTVGPPEAKQEVVVGFSFTPEVQSDPSKVSKAVDTLQKALGPQAHIKVVNVDEKPDVPEGVSVGGKVIVPAKSDGTIDASADAVKKALTP